MFTLRGRQDGFRLLLPKEFIPKHIEEKYTKILQENRSFITKPIDFVNETIQRVEVLGFNNATIEQLQPGIGSPTTRQNRIRENNFLHATAPKPYRSPANPQALIDKTLNVTFRHVLGYLNYFILFESFLYHYSRDYQNSELPKQLSVDLMNEKGMIYAKIILEQPLLDGMDMLSLDYTHPVAESQTFQVVFKYATFDYQFIEAERSNWNGEVE
jgi:hypothetical protein